MGLVFGILQRRAYDDTALKKKIQFARRKLRDSFIPLSLHYRVLLGSRDPFSSNALIAVLPSVTSMKPSRDTDMA
jgi:hypothetical protein